MGVSAEARVKEKGEVKGEGSLIFCESPGNTTDGEGLSGDNKDYSSYYFI